MSEIVTVSHSDDAATSILKLSDIESTSLSIVVSAARPIWVVPIGRQPIVCVLPITGMAPTSRPWEVLRMDVENWQQLQLGVAGVGRSQSRESGWDVGRSDLAPLGCDVDLQGAFLAAQTWSAS